MSGCASVNLTRERFVNSRLGKETFIQKQMNQTVEETVALFDALNDIVSKVDEKYVIFETELGERVSEKAKRELGLQEPSISPDNEISRNAGTHVHNVLYQIANAILFKSTTLEKVKSAALSAPKFKMTEIQFNGLVSTVNSIIADAKKIQKSIDPNKDPIFRLEMFEMDALRNIGGTMDVIVFFSDNTGAIYDYKTTSRNNAIGWDGQSRTVVRNPFPLHDIRAYDLSMTEYKRIATEVYGLKSIRHNRIIPIAITFKEKKFEDREEGSRYKEQIEDLISFQPKSDYMKPIPVGGERSKWEGINKILEAQYSQIARLEDIIKNKNVSDEKKEEIRNRISRMERSIINTLIDEDIDTLLATIDNLMSDVSSRLDEPEVSAEDGEPNPLYVDIVDATSLRQEMEVYRDIIRRTDAYYNDLKKTDPAKYAKLKERIDRLAPEFDRLYTHLVNRHTTLTLDAVDAMYKDEDGHLLPYPELSVLDINFIKISGIDNPIFQTTWGIIQGAQYDIKKKFNELNNEVHEKTDAVFKWAKQNGYSRTEALKILINEKTGNMYGKLSSEFYDKLEKALGSKDAKSIKFMKDNYKIRDPQRYASQYERRKKEYEDTLMIRLNNLKPVIGLDGKIQRTAKELREEYNRLVDWWVTQNDLYESDVAWTVPGNRYRYLKIKDEVVEANLTDEYKRIRDIQPLSDYYDMWTKYMEEFANIFGIQRYGDLPANFIPNIRKEMMEFLGRDGFNVAGSIREFMDSFNVREEDIYIGTANEDGLVRKIPILFLNKLKTDGKIDNTRKSYDLSTSLKIFGHMAYNYQYMNEIEPKILGLRTLMGSPSPEEGAMEVREGRRGRRIRGKISKYQTKEGRNTETYQLLEDITDYYLYGIKFKNTALFLGLDVAHILQKTKNLNSALKLSFAVIPSAGALSAGMTGTYFTGKKGVMYSEDHWRNSLSWMVTDAEKFKALCEYLDPENDSYLERALVEDMASWKKKWLRDRTGFGFLRNADRAIMRTILVAMSQNFGIDKETGKIVRLNRRNLENPAQYGTIWDLVEVVDGKVTVKEMPKKAFMDFRRAVKNTAAEIIGNMNPDDIGKMDTSLLINQMMAFRSWIPEIVRERTGKLRWDPLTQSMKWGRFANLLNEFSDNPTDQEKIDFAMIGTWVTKVFAPKMTQLVFDITTFGVFPSRMIKNINNPRARLMFEKWLTENPSARQDGATFDDFLEIKEAQIKAAIIELRVIAIIFAMAHMMSIKGDDDEPLYYRNYISRTMYKIFTKAGSELTFMWNPTETERLIKNPFPTASLITLLKNTIVNGFDETRDSIFGENSKQDKANFGYYGSQWVYGMPQLTRFFEVFEQQKKTQNQVFQLK